jgi:large conductance mechanosensitive channel
MGIVQEFREFAVKGNVVDLAVGVIIGGAFGKIVSSLVADVVMPPLGVLVGGVNFSALAITLKEADLVASKPPVLLKYGMFLQATFDFMIVALAVFALVKAINSLKRAQAAEPPPPAAPAPELLMLTEIRDLLKKG